MIRSPVEGGCLAVVHDGAPNQPDDKQDWGSQQQNELNSIRSDGQIAEAIMRNSMQNDELSCCWQLGDEHCSRLSSQRLHRERHIHICAPFGCSKLDAADTHMRERAQALSKVAPASIKLGSL